MGSEEVNPLYNNRGCMCIPLPYREFDPPMWAIPDRIQVQDVHHPWTIQFVAKTIDNQRVFVPYFTRLFGSYDFQEGEDLSTLPVVNRERLGFAHGIQEFQNNQVCVQIVNPANITDVDSAEGVYTRTFDTSTVIASMASFDMDAMWSFMATVIGQENYPDLFAGMDEFWQNEDSTDEVSYICFHVLFFLLSTAPS